MTLTHHDKRWPPLCASDIAQDRDVWLCMPLQAWHSARLALVASVVYVPTALGKCVVGYSAKHFDERNLHCGLPMLLGGVSFL